MSRLSRMGLLVNLAQQEVDKAFLTLKEIRMQHERVQVQLNDLKGYLNEYVASLTTSGQHFLPIQLQTTQAFIDKLKQAIVAQQQQVDTLFASLQAAEGQWMEKRLRCNALKKVHEKIKQKEDYRLERAEQKWMDELASQAFIRQK